MVIIPFTDGKNKLQGDFMRQTNVDFRELVAALVHEQWSSWMIFMFGKSDQLSDGGIVIPRNFVERLKRQISISYFNLSEDEKESDRAEADKFIELFSDYMEINHETK